MGDRGNIRVYNSKNIDFENVYLYTHWRGSDIPKIVYEALSRRNRWTDSPYLARIIFCEMVKNDIDGETGYGIANCVQDGEERTLEVDTGEQLIHWKHGKVAWSFDAYIKRPTVSWELFLSEPVIMDEKI